MIYIQNPNEDTEWNAVLRKKGIIPQKEAEITEEQIIDIVERTVLDKANKSIIKSKYLKTLRFYNFIYSKKVI